MDVLAQDYIKVARAKGLPERLVLTPAPGPQRLPADGDADRPVHPALLAGNLITETLFNYQGLGLLFYNSLSKGGLPGAARLHADRRGASSSSATWSRTSR